MTRLLVSVRNAVEAQAAIAGGAEWIDVKEPAHGALGAADPAVWAEVAAGTRGWKPLSAALGELRDDPLRWIGRSSRLLAGYRYAKVGLAGCAADSEWPTKWARVMDSLPRHVARVAVIYADHVACGAPSPERTLERLADRNVGAVLVDTYNKRLGDVFAHWDDARLAGLFATASSSGLLTVLAGSLCGGTLDRALDLAPDLVAVRGAACSGGRVGRVDAGLVKELATKVASRNAVADRATAG